MKNDAYNKFIELKNNESIDKKRVSNIKERRFEKQVTNRQEQEIIK